MMNEWQKLGELGLEEMKRFRIGTRVRLRRMFGGKMKGFITDIQPPIGLLAPRYKCQWDNSDESNFLSSGDLEILS